MENAEEITEAIKKAVLENNFEVHRKFKELTNDLSKDYLQMIFQYYLAERKEKKQDYTPSSLGQLLAEITTTKNEKVCMDLCAGSGSLTIQKWLTNPELKFVCKEVDEKAIPLLLFNLSIRNIEAEVVQEDITSEEVFNVWRLQKGEEFSAVDEAKKQSLEPDTCISNPPFNMKWERMIFAEIQSRFMVYGVPPESNANFLFILTGLRDVKEKASFILPNGVLTGENAAEKEIRKSLVEANRLESVVMCPGKMFESTDIPVSIITVSKQKKTGKIALLDARQICTEEIRQQRGQCGGASHTKRVYEKKINTFSKLDIEKILRLLKEEKTQIPINEIKAKEYELNPALYQDIEFVDTSREYEAIVRDLNRVIKQKNCFKLTINETVAKSTGLDVELFKKAQQVEKGMEELRNLVERICGIRIEQDDYIAFSKNKNEIKFENKSKEELSPILPVMVMGWAQHIRFLNCEENRYLAELRDKLLPHLLTGKGEV